VAALKVVKNAITERERVAAYRKISHKNLADPWAFAFLGQDLDKLHTLTFLLWHDPSMTQIASFPAISHQPMCHL
jgi:hypothetical protein